MNTFYSLLYFSNLKKEVKRRVKHKEYRKMLTRVEITTKIAKSKTSQNACSATDSFDVRYAC